MVICGGLEILAAGYLLNEFNKDKVEARERRKRRDTGEGRPHNHSQPPPVEGRPQHYPQNVEHPPQGRPTNFLQPPPQAPPRPISAPPIDPRPSAGWQNSQPHLGQQPYGPQQMRPQQSNNPYLQALQNDQMKQHPAPWQQPVMGAMQPGPHPSFNGPPPPAPGHLQHANSFHPGVPPPNFQQGPPPPGPGHLQRPNTFQAPQNMSQPNIQSSNTFPIQQQAQPPAAVKPPPAGPLFYVDTKTGRISHNMYPADHPMARGPGSNNHDLSKDLWGDDNYKRTAAGDINTGMMWSERDENDLAYGKDYSDRDRGGRRRRRSSSYERTRRRTDSDPYRY